MVLNKSKDISLSNKKAIEIRYLGRALFKGILSPLYKSKTDKRELLNYIEIVYRLRMRRGQILRE